MKTLSLLILIFIIYACNPQNIRRERGEQAPPDSFLYYQPVAMENAFLDSMNTKYDQEVALKMRIIPPPPPPAPTVKQVDGFRIQLFAGADSMNVLTSAENIKRSLPDSLYFLKENNLFKIQLGDFLYRNDADLKLMDLRSHGYPGAWVVKTRINVPVESLVVSKTEKDTTQAVNQDAKFRIQVLVTSSAEKAENLIEQLKIQFKHESYFDKSGTFYKIYLGRFGTREQAENTLSQVKNAGYTDAWLVY